MAAPFTLEGGRALEAAMTEFSKPMAKAVGRRALKKAADPILAAWRGGSTRRTGDLIESEVVGTKLNKRQAKMNRKLDSKSAVEVHIGTNDPAGRLEEFGGIHNSPQPALRSAWDAEGGQRAVERIGVELAADIEKTAARVRRRAGR